MRGKAQRVARPAQTRLQNSGVTGRKFIKFSPDVEELSAVLTRAPMLRFAHCLSNASAQNEGGLCQFSLIHGKKNLQRPLTDRK